MPQGLSVKCRHRLGMVGRSLIAVIIDSELVPDPDHARACVVPLGGLLCVTLAL